MYAGRFVRFWCCSMAWHALVDVSLVFISFDEAQANFVGTVWFGPTLVRFGDSVADSRKLMRFYIVLTTLRVYAPCCLHLRHLRMLCTRVCFLHCFQQLRRSADEACPNCMVWPDFDAFLTKCCGLVSYSVILGALSLIECSHAALCRLISFSIRRA